ncbi:hypothetical protein L1987_37168 [Smallanthus sonchifolius]|uniref:Uncharacterized protein n=1 Tax=Smallanthus sonchifolius TaxID=185202 RepID=A0ACB9HGW1_9ASTR|nr:hypothetical protein L1987_37168 [Smallanthus sonchifolius]
MECEFISQNEIQRSSAPPISPFTGLKIVINPKSPSESTLFSAPLLLPTSFSCFTVGLGFGIVRISRVG